METSSTAEHQQLRVRNAQLEEKLELLRGVLALVKEDLHVKDHQIDDLYLTYVQVIASMLTRLLQNPSLPLLVVCRKQIPCLEGAQAHKRQKQEQRENALKQQVGALETQIRANERSFRRLQSSTKLEQSSRTSTHDVVSPDSHLEELPTVLVVNVLTYLDMRCIVRAACAHRNLHAVVIHNAFWARIFTLRWRRSDEKQGFRRVRVFAAKYLSVPTKQSGESERNSGGEPQRSGAAKGPIDWTALYCERHVVERSWANWKAAL